MKKILTSPTERSVVTMSPLTATILCVRAVDSVSQEQPSKCTTSSISVNKTHVTSLMARSRAHHHHAVSPGGCTVLLKSLDYLLHLRVFHAPLRVATSLPSVLSALRRGEKVTLPNLRTAATICSTARVSSSVKPMMRIPFCTQAGGGMVSKETTDCVVTTLLPAQ